MIYLQVIWAIGIAMIAMSFLVYMKDKYILLLAVIIIAGHNLFHHVAFHDNTCEHYAWCLMLQKTILAITDFLSVRTTYPFLRVIGVMALGYVVTRVGLC